VGNKSDVSDLFGSVSSSRDAENSDDFFFSVPLSLPCPFWDIRTDRDDENLSSF
jgi:hypothetical protein